MLQDSSQTPPPRVRAPFLTAAVLVLTLAQHERDWAWGLNGWTSGLDRALHSVTAVLAHADAAHLQTNTIGVLFAVAAVEMLIGRRWLVAVFLVAVADMYFFTDHYTHIRGASGLVMAATGTLVAVVPAAWRTWRRAGTDWRSRMQIGAGSFCVMYLPSAAWSDLRSLGIADEVAQDAHLRCLAAGVLLGVFATALRARSARLVAIQQPSCQP